MNAQRHWKRSAKTRPLSTTQVMPDNPRTLSPSTEVITMSEPNLATDATDAPDPVAALKALEAPGPARRLFTHFLAHYVVVVGVLAIWAAADAWQHITQLRAAAWLSVASAMVAGAAVTAILHEWGHYLGARLSGAASEIPEKKGLLMFNFDFAKNTPRQFDIMSWAGQAGGALAIVLLWVAIPMDTAGRVMLLCSGIGYVAFTVAFEWPIIMRARQSGEPLAELAKVTRNYIQHSEAIGAATGLLVWLIAA